MIGWSIGNVYLDTYLHNLLDNIIAHPNSLFWPSQVPASSGVTTLSWWGSLRVSVTLELCRLESCSLVWATHAEKVEG